MIARLIADEDGQTQTEYAVFLTLIALASMTILFVLGIKFRNMYVDTNMRTTSTK